MDFLEEHGKQIRQMLFTRSHRNDKVLAAIAVRFMFLCLPTPLNSSYRSMRLSLQKGFCPDLELLEVNKKLDSKDTELSVCFQSLQKACPKLKVIKI